MAGEFLRKAEVYVKNKGLIYLVGVILIALALFGCDDDDCPTCPGNESGDSAYEFLYSFVGTYSTAWVLTYSTKRAEAVDSAYYGKFPFNDVRYSRDGQRAYYSVNDGANSATWITDASTGDTISLINGIWSQWIQLFSDERHLLLAGGGIYARILAVPSLEIVFEEVDSSGWGEGAVHPETNTAYVPKPAEDSLLILRLNGEKVLREKYALRNLSGQPCRAISAQFSAYGEYLILSAGDYPSGDGYTQVRDPETLEVLKEFRLTIPLSRAYPRPTGNRVYFTEGVRWEEGNFGAIWELDLSTFIFQRVLDGSNLILTGSARRVFDPVDMDFTPDGEMAVIASRSGPILVAELPTFHVVGSMHPRAGATWIVRVNPK